MRPTALLLLAALACIHCGTPPAAVDAASDIATDAEQLPDVRPDVEPTCTQLTWDPMAADMSRWPEPVISMADPTTRTGQRLRVDPMRFPGLLRSAGGYAGVITEDLRDLDGFGVNSAAFFRFNRAFDPTMMPMGNAQTMPSSGAGFVVLGATPRRIPGIFRLTDRNTTVMLYPLQPLPPRAQVAVYLSRALTAAARGCLEPSPAMRATIATPDAPTTQALAALMAVGAVSGPSDVVALTVFGTQSTTDDSQAVATDIASRTFAFRTAPMCTTEAQWRRCELQLPAGDYRGADRVYHPPMTGSPAPVANYVLPVTVWLPLAGMGTAPYPTIVFGHGLGGGRTQAAQLAGFAAPQGIATVAIDAVQHGDHPTIPAMASRDALSTILRFFTLTPGGADGRAMRALELRDNFRQSTWDKLQLTRVLRTSPDVTGDSMPDLDGTRLAYLGVSLGGIMGPELIALTDAYRAAVLVVPGARISSIISDSTQFRPLVLLARPSGVSDGDVDRFFGVLQSVIDRADPGSYAPNILADRLPVGGAMAIPNTLLGVVLDDDTVPNSANYALARALGVSIVPPVLRAEVGLGMTAPPPVVANVGMTATAGLLQFDVIRSSTGTVSRATHGNVGASIVGAAAWLHFLRTHWDAGRAEIIDPYMMTGLMHP